MSSDRLSPALTRLERQETISVQVAHELLEYLLSGEIKVGDRLPSERSLADILGVGRSAIRDALKPLTLLGILEVRQGSGTYLKSRESDVLPSIIEWGLLIGDKTMADLVEARKSIEIALATLAADRRNEDSLARLRNDLNCMNSATSIEAFTEADSQFHLHLADAAGNAVLSGILHSIRSLLRVWISRVVSEADTTSRLCDQHRAILEAVETGKADAAGRAMDVHLESVTRDLRAGLSRESQDSLWEENGSDGDRSQQGGRQRRAKGQKAQHGL